MIQTVRAVREDTRAVQLPVVGIDGDGDGLLDDSGGQLVNVTLGDIGEATDLEGATSSGAGSVNSGVGIRVFGGDTVGLDIGETVIHQSTVAALVALRGGAIDQLLLGEGLQSLAGQEGQTFQRSSGGEGPA